MVDPVTYKQLVEELDKRFKEHNVHHKDIKEILSNQNKYINGDNGTPGLRIRVDRIETTNSMVKKFLGGLVALWGIVIGYLGLK
jgi:hypothetical protein